MTARLSELISALPVEDEGPCAGYHRREFKHWADSDRDGCDTRAEVLLRDAVTAPQITGRCTIAKDTGTWYSWYDDTTQTSKLDVDIDHIVALGEASDSGARAWTAAEREAYANDLDDPRALLAVHDKSNQSKADRDPSEWMPPAVAASCRYITDWVVVKVRWGLSADGREHAAIQRIAAGCDDPVVTVVLARSTRVEPSPRQWGSSLAA
ncbi:HNH endonuclease family protein [Streptomyces sp. CMB-StM0423]|uniref:HNH endonuclease family protein n=1 Tax=Streptomyces sp. CMB-StM0423 TaxID=2059884 RepID=UPI001F32959C|nr:HNH endonuclease family protein [Streptomyces sp. CMB-StM0423]